MRKISGLPPISDAEEAAIQAGIAKDPDNPELTEAEIAAMRPASEVLPPELYAALTKRRILQSDEAFDRPTFDPTHSGPPSLRGGGQGHSR